VLGTTPQVSVNPDGNALAVWQHQASVPPGATIWASSYTAAGGWYKAERIDPRDISNATNPQIAIDPAGNALAVWQEDLGSSGIWQNRYTRDSGWIFYNGIVSSGAANPQVALDPAGNALAVWQQTVNFNRDTRLDIWASRYTPAGAWGAPERIEASNAGNATNAQVELDQQGKGIAIWEQFDGTRWSIWANRYTPSGGWSTAQRVESNGAGDARRPRIASDRNGNCLAAWIHSDGTRFNAWSNRYTPGGGWGTPELIEENDGDAIQLQIAVDPNGNALAVWLQSEGTHLDLWSNRYTQQGGWGTAELLETSGNKAYLPQVAADARGNGLVVWYQSGDTPTRNDIWANRFE